MTEQRGPWHGRFVWHDLMTTDFAKSLAFYGALFEWDVKTVPMGECAYGMIHVGATPIGGFVEEKSIPVSHWMPYCSVPDVDAAAERCKQLGGTVCVPPTDIPSTGRFAVCLDPQGAGFSLYTGLPESPGADPDSAEEGRVCWNELMSTDDEAAQAFYTALLGWRPEPKDMGPLGQYRVQMNGAVHAGGIMKNPQPGAPSWWCVYFSVADLERSTAKAARLGAQVLMADQAIEEIGRFSLLQDPNGAVFALFQGR